MTHSYSRSSADWGRAWFGLLAPPVAYFVQLLLGYALVPVACSSTRAPLVILSALMFLVTAAAVFTSYQQWRELSRGGEAMSFLSLMGALLGVLFLLLVAVTGIGTGLLEACRL